MLSEAVYLGIKREVDKRASQRSDVYNPSPFATIGEISGYVIECARQGELEMDESDAIEVFVRLLGLNKSQIADIIKTLKPLGYDAVCTRLTALRAKAKPGKRQLSLRQRVAKVQTARARAKLGLKAKKRSKISDK